MLPHTLSEETGFTLIEAVVAAALVAAALVAVAHLAAIGIRQSATSGRALSALLAAQGKLEQLTATALVFGDGDEPGESFLRWTIAPLDPSDPTIVSLQVCAYASRDVNVRPEACVATLRASEP